MCLLIQIRRINDDIIKVLVSNSDLNERGITVLDLLGKHDQIKDFFYDILKEVDTKHQFIDDKSVVFQVLPSKSGLELIITKGNQNSIENAEKFNQNDNVNYDDKDINLSDQQFNSDSNIGKHNSLIRKYVIKLNDFDDLIRISKILKINNGSSNLYKYKGNYYLQLTFFLSINGEFNEENKDDLALAYEYGDETNITSDILSEYGKKIMDTSALELTRYYFK